MCVLVSSWCNLPNFAYGTFCRYKAVGVPIKMGWVMYFVINLNV
jgi:hypothetical protein